MSEHLLLGLASIIVLGIAAQWLAWRLHLPSILLLLIFGFIAGPVSGVLNPDELFGNLLFPLVSVSVAIILFEGGLSLKINELRQVGTVFTSLVTVGIMVTWFLVTVLAHFVAGIQWPPAILLGAILVVSGPTVIIPLLRQVRPVGHLSSIVKWEGIVNDPLGAILAVIVFEVILAGSMQEGTALIIFGVLKALIFGSMIGIAGAAVMVLMLKRYLIPDFLQNPVALMVVVLVYFVSNTIQLESGLLAVTVMGTALANQKFVPIKHILEFKESLRVLLISSLFIILAARVPLGQLSLTSPNTWIFVGLLIVLVRPAAVLASTFKSKLKWNERAFLAWMAPRGIVAAAVVSVFAERLMDTGFTHCSLLVPLTFQVIVGTVAVYGLTASPVAHLLKVAKPNPQGVLLVGAHTWVQDIGRLLRDEGLQVVMVDSNWTNIVEARRNGCRAYYGNVLAEDLLYDIQLDGVGRLLALTPNDEVNSLAALHFLDIFGSSEVYQLPPSGTEDNSKKHALPSYLRGRFLFDKIANYEYLSFRVRSGAIIKKTPLTEEFDYNAFIEIYGQSAIPLFIITENKELKVYTTDKKPTPRAGQTLISLVGP
ncbi:MAG: sodium:proton antiporter [candidate division Zixibacteria bacterium]|nr:sodium:proton antiporter [candidate division Zixibacteria bacterium]